MTQACGARPELTFPAEEASAVLAAYREAAVILEYGSGGSTVMAADLPDKRIFSVESDSAWIDRMRAWFALHPPASVPVLHHANIGPTRKWGYPTDESTRHLWPDYAQGIWEQPEFPSPVVVLIDGRFRLACLYTTALLSQHPVVALIDDYDDRPSYHKAEMFLGQPVMIGRMARFDLTPGIIAPDQLALVADSYTRPL